MPPQLQALLENRRLLIAVGVGVVSIILLMVLVFSLMGNGGKKSADARVLGEEERVLATMESGGRPIEVQALMAREGINLIRQDVEGGKTNLVFEKDATIQDRDRALVTLVQSGLMDKNVGLEVFDKGDLTASRDEKRIKLARARNGELSRLIRKIDPVQDASVFISIPEPTLFEKDKKDPTATVQVSVGVGQRLSADKVRAIINLLVGSVEGLKPTNVSLTDTNGNVYNSVLDSSFEIMAKLEERDHYMEQKVMSQLDKLVGNGKYVVTVATYLRETAKESLTLDYDSDESAIAKSSQFNENMDANEQAGVQTGGPATSNLPDELGLRGWGQDDQKSSQGYARNGREVEFNTGKRQVSEDFHPGMLEEITVAVTVDADAYPSNIPVEELKNLVARSASPLVNPANVTVLVDKPGGTLQPVQPAQTSHATGMIAGIPDWVLWAGMGGSALMILLLVSLLLKPSGGSVAPKEVAKQEEAIKNLQQLAQAQSQQLQNQQEQTKQLLDMQQQQLSQLQASGAGTGLLPQSTTPSAGAQRQQPAEDITAALRDIGGLMDDDLDDDYAPTHQQTADMLAVPSRSGLQSWIEQ